MARQKAREAAETALRKTEQLAQAEALADALRKKRKPKEGGLGDKARKEALEELARLTRAAAREGEQLKHKIDSNSRWKTTLVGYEPFGY